MRLFTQLRTRFGAAVERKTKRKPATRFRPRLESLEDRSMLSTLTVLNTNDGGAGSLRADIAAAHSGDTIQFNPALFASGPQTINLTKGELLINKNLTISGPGAGELTISGGNLSREFEAAAGANVGLSGMTLTKGFATNGGGVLNNGTLTISNCTLSGNFATKNAKGATNAGGAIDNFGTLTVSGGTLSGNSATSAGGIDNNGTATISASTLSANSATGTDGGGVVSRGTLSVSHSQFLNNTAVGDGGGIENYGTATIDTSTLSGNSSSSMNGGAIANVGSSLTVTASNLSGNHAHGDGGGIDTAGNANARIVVSGSTLSGNSAYAGGGIYTWNVHGTTTISDCTLTGNSTIYGGAIFAGSATMTVSGSTLSGNSAYYGGAIDVLVGAVTIDGGNLTNNTALTAGGGLYVNGPNSYYGTPTVTVENSSGINGNTAPAGEGADIYNLGVVYVDSTSIGRIGVVNGNPVIPI